MYNEKDQAIKKRRIMYTVLEWKINILIPNHVPLEEINNLEPALVQNHIYINAKVLKE